MSLVLEIVPQQKIWFHFDQKGNLAELLGQRLQALVSTDNTYAVGYGFAVKELDDSKLVLTLGRLIIANRVIVIDDDTTLDLTNLAPNEGDKIYIYICYNLDASSKCKPCTSIDFKYTDNEAELDTLGDNCYKFMTLQRINGQLQVIEYPNLALHELMNLEYVEEVIRCQQNVKTYTLLKVYLVHRVFYNGNLLAPDIDYIVTHYEDSSAITLVSVNPNEGDILDIRGFS